MLKLSLLFRICAEDPQLEMIKSYSIFILNHLPQSLQGKYILSFKHGVLCKSQDFKVSMGNPVFLYELAHELCNDKPVFNFYLAEQKIKYQLRPQVLAYKIKDCQDKQIREFSIDIPIPKPKSTTILPSLCLHKSRSISHYKHHKVSIKNTLDLHLNKDVKIEDVRRNNNIILEAQMEIFRLRFELVRSQKLPTLTVIHGKGDGILKKCIHAFIQKEHPNLHLESHYDGGRTTIYFTQP